LHPSLPYIAAEVVWAAREEMARTVDDVLARRTLALFLNAKAAIDLAPKVAQMLAQELNRDEAWQQQQVREFTAMAAQYVATPALAGTV
jgi:glycerol-3-phosphate dehydrogenase